MEKYTKMKKINIFTFKQIAQRLPSIPKECFVNTFVLPFRPIRPRVLVYNVTFRCNSRCIMCSNWQRDEKDLGLEEIKKVFTSPLFKRIENLGISGGEPTLREDLPDIIGLACTNLPSLKKININTNGLSPRHTTKILKSVIDICHSKRVMCSMRISIDGLELTNDKARGVPGSFKQAEETLFSLKEYQKQRFFNLGILCTVTKDTYKDMEKLWDWTSGISTDIVYNVVRVSGPALGNEELRRSLELDKDSRDYITNLLWRLIRLKGILSPDSYIYYHFAKMLQNNYNRVIPCPFIDQGLMLNPNGNLFYCENSPCIGNVLDKDPQKIYFDNNNLTIRKRLAYSTCQHCISPCQANIGAIKQILPYIKFIMSTYAVDHRSTS